jgi:hypothetical protein
MINSEPATVRRLFSAGHVNPILGTLAEVAAALGMRVVPECCAFIGANEYVPKRQSRA